jgi:hypothetical protein
LFEREAVTLDLPIAGADAAVKAVVFAKVGEFDEAAKENLLPIILGAYGAGLGEQVFYRCKVVCGNAMKKFFVGQFISIINKAPLPRPKELERGFTG